MPSAYMSRCRPGPKPVGIGPPMSSQWVMLAAKPSNVPSWKIGITAPMSFTWLPPRYGSL